LLKGLLPSLIIIFLFVIIYGYKLTRKKIALLNFIYGILFGCYIANLVSVVFFPLPLQKRLIREMIDEHLGELNNFIPFHTILHVLNTESLEIALRQIAGNIILFIPLSFGIFLLCPTMKVKKVLLIGILSSVIIECLQGIVGQFIGYNYRSTDIDDVILNSIGTIIGISVWKIAFHLLESLGLVLKSSSK